jgi:tubulin-specific chaperone C
LKDLEASIENLRVSAVPKTKFTFRRKPNNNEPKPASDGDGANDALTSTRNKIEAGNIQVLQRTISSLSGKQIGYDILPPSEHASDLLISDLESCTVNLVPPRGGPDPPNVGAIHIKNIRDTTLILPVITGSVLLQDLNRCVVAVGCHQVGLSPC